jgi:hypothetical protein
MTPWNQRSREEQALLNPGFCANLIWHSAFGHAIEGNGTLAFEESFLILPFVLHREIREILPRTTRTSLAVWLDENPLVRGKVTNRARLMVPFTKEALIFGGMRGFIRIDGGNLYAVDSWKKAVIKTLKNASDEVKDCAKRAEFIGKWFSQTGNATTVLALIGVCP